MREIKTYQDFAAWRRTAKQGEHVIYCGGGMVLDREVAIERAIIDASDVKVDHHRGSTVLTAKSRRNRGKGGKPQRSTLSHIAGAASIGARNGVAWSDLKDKEPGKKKVNQVRKALLREANGPARPGRDRGFEHIMDTYFRP